MSRFKVYSIINISSGFTLAVLSPIIIVLLYAVVLPFAIAEKIGEAFTETLCGFTAELGSLRGIVAKQIKLGIEQWSRK